MKRSMQYLAVGCLFAVAALGSQGIADAQFRSNGYQAFLNNRNQAYANMVGMQNAANVQQLFNNQLQQLYSTQYYGSNINPVTFPNFFQSYTPTYYPPYNPTPGYNPYVPQGGNPYLPTSGGYGSNPYLPTDPSAGGQYNPYSPYNSQNNSYGGGSVLTGSADVIRAQGGYLTSLENARFLREKANQEKITTVLKEHEARMIIKATTPTFTQEQARIAKSTLQRIQKNSLPGEIANGKSLNLLLKDLLTFTAKAKQSSLEPLQLTEPVLSQLNVTKSTFGMGALRDNGKVVWPSAVQGLMSVNQRQDMDKKLMTLVRNANIDQVNKDALTDVRNEIDRLREDLVKKINDVPTMQYIEGKRFLQELEDATRAVDKREAINQQKFQRFIEGGKQGRSIQEVVEYMGENGLQFAPATSADEASYRAAHQAMATFDLAMNSQFASEN